MKSWTRTLNLDDAHDLLALATPGLPRREWVEAAHAALPGCSVDRRRELVRLVRDGYIEWSEDRRVSDALFLRLYARAPALAQIDLVQVQWALQHPLTLIAVETLVAPALERREDRIPLEVVEALVERHLETSSAESIRKTRTVLLGAMEGIGALVTRGTGQHRSLRASRGAPHPLSFAYLLLRDLQDRRADGMMRSEAAESSLGARLTQCTPAHGAHCLDEAVRAGLLVVAGDEVRPAGA